MSSAPKRLVAYVEKHVDPAAHAWWSAVVEESAHASALIAHWEIRCNDALGAIVEAEQLALGRGFDLRWHGFVAHGVEVQREEKGER